MSTSIRKVFAEFLEEKQRSLSPKTFGFYDSSVGLFEAYLNGYTYKFFEDDKERCDWDRAKESGVEFVDYFNPEFLDVGDFLGFTGWFLGHKVMCGSGTLKRYQQANTALYRWLAEKSLIHTKDLRFDLRELRDTVIDEI